ncbi:MAG: helix-turn-helix domain-containing protein, partial [Chloroflexi bacterium]|nr:helix-turn-helix domain-containing protein [Chloroflexota bacterium]
MELAQADRLYAVIGQRLLWARQRQGITQEELAQHIGLTRTSIANIERGRQRVQIHTLYTLAKVLHVPLGTLLPVDETAVDARISEEVATRPPEEQEWIRRIVGGR